MDARQIALDLKQKPHQKSLMLWILEYARFLDAQRLPDPIPWTPRHPAGRRNASSRAALSRRLRKLAARGLVERIGNGRTQAIRLTELGRNVGQLLTS